MGQDPPFPAVPWHARMPGIQHHIMSIHPTFRGLSLLFSLAMAGTAVAADPSPPASPARFTEDWSSLKEYKCPEWFRDAKFGIWAHWGPQAVPMEGDWYARHMYKQGHRQYNHHLENYGHPSKHRVQGHHSPLEGGKMGARPSDGALQKGRGQVFREHGGAPRQFRFVELETPQVERGEYGAEARRGRGVAASGAQGGPEVRGFRAPCGELHLVGRQQRSRREWPAGRRAV